MIKPFTTDKGSFIAVRVPDNSDKYFIGGFCPTCNKQGLYHCMDTPMCGETKDDLKSYNGDELIENTEIPTGNYHLIGKASELTEEQWKEIVDCKYDNRWVDYESKGSPNMFFSTPEYSFKSLARANGFYWEKNEQYVILKEVK